MGGGGGNIGAYVRLCTLNRYFPSRKPIFKKNYPSKSKYSMEMTLTPDWETLHTLVYVQHTYIRVAFGNSPVSITQESRPSRTHLHANGDEQNLSYLSH